MMHRFVDRFRSLLTALAGALLGVALVLLYLQIAPPGGKYSDADIKSIAQSQIDQITPSPPVEPAIYALIRPDVVTITHPLPDGQEGQAVGSGVVVDENGSILTAYHVVAGNDTVNVEFYDGSTATGTVVQTQPDRDLAMLQVRRLPANLQPATLAGGVQEGDKVLAIGSPYGLEGSVTEGVVSALGRSFVVQETGQVLQNMIQFDAAVNPGNSGGPLIDMNGHVVGIVSGITPQQFFVGLGFAVPIESASGILPPLG